MARRGGRTPWDVLTTLKMNAAVWQRMPEEMVDIVHKEARVAVWMPSLVDLELSVHELGLWKRFVPWRQLVRLNLRVESESVEDLVRVIYLCRRTLRECRLRAVTFLDSEEGYPDRMVPVTFPVLETFEMNMVGTNFGDGSDPPSPLTFSPVGAPLDFFFKAVDFPAARDIKLVHAKGTIAVDPSAFLQFMSSCAHLEKLHLGFINFAIPTLFNAAELGRGYVSVLKSLPESVTSLTISVRGLREKRRSNPENEESEEEESWDDEFENEEPEDKEMEDEELEDKELEDEELEDEEFKNEGPEDEELDDEDPENEEPENEEPKKKKLKPEEPSKEPSEVLWLADPALDSGSLLPNLKRLKIMVGGESKDSFDTSVWVMALKGNLGRFCARRCAEGKSVEFVNPERQCDKLAYIEFGAPFADE